MAETRDEKDFQHQFEKGQDFNEIKKQQGESSQSSSTCFDIELDVKKQRAHELKTLGNENFKSGKYHDAIDLFSQAIELDDCNETLYCNRSMSYASLGKLSFQQNSL